MPHGGGDAVGSEAARPRSLRRFVMAALALCVVGAFLLVPRVLNHNSAGDERAIEEARWQAHVMLLESVRDVLPGLGLSPSSREDVEAFLRDGLAYQSLPLLDWEVGAPRGDVLPVSVYFYRERANGLSSLDGEGYGVACVEYRIGESWEVVDVPCGKEAKRGVRTRDSVTSS